MRLAEVDADADEDEEEEEEEHEEHEVGLSMQARLDKEIVDACIACHNDRDINIKGSIVTDWLAQHRLRGEIGELEEEEEEDEAIDSQCRAVCTGEAK